MGDGLRRFTDEEIQAALGDAPFVVQGMWPAGSGAADPSPDPAPPGRSLAGGAEEQRNPAERNRPVSLAPVFAAGMPEGRKARARSHPAPPDTALAAGTPESHGAVTRSHPASPTPVFAAGMPEGRKAKVRSYPASPDPAFAAGAPEGHEAFMGNHPASPDPIFAAGTPEGRGTVPRRMPKRRRWPPALVLAGAAFAGGSVGLAGILLITPAPAPREDVRAVPAAPPVFNAGAPQALTAAPAPGAPVLRHDVDADAEAAAPKAAEAPLFAEPPASGAAALKPPPAVPSAAAVAATDPPFASGAPRPSDPTLAAALLQRAEDALALRDVAAARAFFIRAAAVDSWSVEAMLGAGRTYDPGFLSPLGVSAALADPAQARQWYERASRLGDPVASILARGLGDGR